jgi:hypothetical protein
MGTCEHWETLVFRLARTRGTSMADSSMRDAGEEPVCLQRACATVPRLRRARCVRRVRSRGCGAPAVCASCALSLALLGACTRTSIVDTSMADAGAEPVCVPRAGPCRATVCAACASALAARAAEAARARGRAGRPHAVCAYTVNPKP